MDGLGLRRRLTLTLAVVLAAGFAGVGTADAATYPGPGKVTGSIGVHDPGVVKRTDGTYLIAYTGNNIPLKTSSDRTAWKDVGAAFPGGASSSQSARLSAVA